MDNIMAYKSKLTYEEVAPAIQKLSTVRYSVIKGEALSITAYNKVGNRISSDLDVLMSRKNLHIFERELLELGFEKQHAENIIEQRTSRVLMLSGSHQISPYYLRKAPFTLSIDLNFDIFWGEYMGKRVDIDDFLSDTIDMEIYGVKVKALPPLKTMVQLILHHYKDMNSIFLLSTRKSIKYNMFKDIYYLLKNNRNSITLDKLYAISSKYEIIPYVYYILYHTGLLFEDCLLKEYVLAFKTLEGETLIDCYGLNELERHHWKCDFKTRLESQNLYELIKNDLTEKDIEKISINKKVFFSE